MSTDELIKITENILTDISNNYILSDISGIFQNHLFGCLSILEFIDDGNAMVDNARIHIRENTVDLHESFDLSADFHLIGDKLGFWEGTKGLLTINFDEQYRTRWLSLFSLFQDLSSICGFVEDFEEKCYTLFLERLGKECPFVVFIEGGVIEPSIVPTEAGTVAVPAPTNPTKVRGNLNKTARRRRGATPIFKRKGFNKTRKNLKTHV